MYLKNIRAYGFKSFADKIDIEVKKGITAIVGPNGSGKSNIVDAVRWVLGEQSIKSLRGTEAMSDVIFSGSKSRDALTRAYVSLVFDNSDHYLNSDFKEIEIKRVIYHTGENEYFINNSKVRLKDITNLFMDTGAGTDSFNIISQGSVSDIISSKPEARRTIFEDAAGVLKYKHRKEESLRKLDKTKENISKIKLVIDELEKCLTLKEELKTNEIALVANDIAKINIDYKKIQAEVDTLKMNLTKMTTTGAEDTSKLEKLKLENLKLEEEITKKNNALLNLTENLASLEAEKLVTMERKKYQAKKDNLEAEMIKLKEEELAIKKEYQIEKAKLEDLIADIKEKSLQKDEVDNELLKEKLNKNNLQASLNDLSKTILVLENKIEILKDNIHNNSKLPQAVRSVLHNMRLKGVHNTIGNIISTDKIYEIAIATSLGGASNFLVVDDEKESKECITYLKENHLGRATFFPLNIIKPREIAQTDLEQIKGIAGFIDIASNLVEFKKEYEAIVKNQLGNVLVVQDIDTLNKIGKILNYRYKIVSLDGEVLYVGGSITGGDTLNKSALNDKLQLSELEEKLELSKLNLEKKNAYFQEFMQNFANLEAKSSDLSKNLINLNEILNTRTNKVRNLEEELAKKELEIKGNEDIHSNKLDQKLVDILEETTEISSKKDLLNVELNKLKAQKSDLALQITEIESLNHEATSNYNRIQNTLKEKEIILGKYDVKLDNLLLNLSDNYSMTYEYAATHYELNMEAEDARIKVEHLKKEIQDLGEVNTGSIKEYERIKERYEFLLNQSNDLEVSSQELHNIIKEMDEIMIAKFKTTFDLISK